MNLIIFVAKHKHFQFTWCNKLLSMELYVHNCIIFFITYIIKQLRAPVPLKPEHPVFNYMLLK